MQRGCLAVLSVLLVGCDAGEINAPLGTVPISSIQPDAAPATVSSPASTPDAPPVATAPAAARHARCGYIGYGEEAGYQTFIANANFFDAIHPDWYALSSDAVSLTPLRGVNDSRVLQAARSAGVRVIPLIASVDDPAPTLTMLATSASRAAHIQALVKIARDSSYDGLEIDYEHISGTHREELTAFYGELATALHAVGLEASAAVYADPFNLSAYDYAAIAARMDHVHIMAYDFHGVTSHSGPLAPLGWVKATIALAVSTGQGKKFILALPNYGFTMKSFGTTAACIARCNGSYATTTKELETCIFNVEDHFEAGRQPNCMTSEGPLYFDDTASFEEKVKAAHDAGLGGVGYWTLSGEPDGFFAMLKKYY